MKRDRSNKGEELSPHTNSHPWCADASLKRLKRDKDGGDEYILLKNAILDEFHESSSRPYISAEDQVSISPAVDTSLQSHGESVPMLEHKTVSSLQPHNSGDIDDADASVWSAWDAALSHLSTSDPQLHIQLSSPSSRRLREACELAAMARTQALAAEARVRVSLANITEIETRSAAKLASLERSRAAAVSRALHAESLLASESDKAARTVAEERRLRAALEAECARLQTTLLESCPTSKLRDTDGASWHARLQAAEGNVAHCNALLRSSMERQAALARELAEAAAREDALNAQLLDLQCSRAHEAVDRALADSVLDTIEQETAATDSGETASLSQIPSASEVTSQSLPDAVTLTAMARSVVQLRAQLRAAEEALAAARLEGARGRIAAARAADLEARCAQLEASAVAEAHAYASTTADARELQLWRDGVSAALRLAQAEPLHDSTVSLGVPGAAPTPALLSATQAAQRVRSLVGRAASAELARDEALAGCRHAHQEAANAHARAAEAEEAARVAQAEVLQARVEATRQRVRAECAEAEASAVGRVLLSYEQEQETQREHLEVTAFGSGRAQYATLVEHIHALQAALVDARSAVADSLGTARTASTSSVQQSAPAAVRDSTPALSPCPSPACSCGDAACRPVCGREHSYMLAAVASDTSVYPDLHQSNSNATCRNHDTAHMHSATDNAQHTVDASSTSPRVTRSTPTFDCAPHKAPSEGSDGTGTEEAVACASCETLLLRFTRLLRDHEAACAEVQRLLPFAAQHAQEVGEHKVVHLRLNPAEVARRALHQAKDELIAHLRAQVACAAVPGGGTDTAALLRPQSAPPPPVAPRASAMLVVLDQWAEATSSPAAEESSGPALPASSSPPSSPSPSTSTSSMVHVSTPVSSFVPCSCGAREALLRARAEATSLQALREELAQRVSTLATEAADLRSAHARAEERHALADKRVQQLRELQSGHERVILRLKNMFGERAASFRTAVSEICGFKISQDAQGCVVRYARSPDLTVSIAGAGSTLSVTVDGFELVQAHIDGQTCPLPTPIVGSLFVDRDVPMFLARLLHYLRKRSGTS